MADAAVQRTNMVDSQVRPSDITDRRIVRAMQEVERERFVPESIRSIAYSDGDIRAGGAGRVLMAPRTFAKLVQLANIEPTDSVLVVGSGSGYSTAVVAKLAHRVLALESDAALATEARRAVGDAANVSFAGGPLAEGDPARAKFDVILVDGAIPGAPEQLVAQLADGGRLVAIVAGQVGKACVWTRNGASVSEVRAFDAVTAVLPGFTVAAGFQF